MPTCGNQVSGVPRHRSGLVSIDDGLTKLERAQIEQGREAYLTGGAKLRYKRLTGQI